MPKRRRRSRLPFATEWGLASLHTATTLFYRLPMFGIPYPGAAKPEFGRMISEKAAAMVEGALDAQVEAMRIAGDAMTGQLDLADFANAPTHVAAAAMRPAFRRVKANSRRLHRRRVKT
jgi:hypothetical protein